MVTPSFATHGFSALLVSSPQRWSATEQASHCLRDNGSDESKPSVTRVAPYSEYSCRVNDAHVVRVTCWNRFTDGLSPDAATGKARWRLFQARAAPFWPFPWPSIPEFALGKKNFSREANFQ
jgi:hypothetical protein